MAVETGQSGSSDAQWPPAPATGYAVERFGSATVCRAGDVLTVRQPRLEWLALCLVAVAFPLITAVPLIERYTILIQTPQLAAHHQLAAALAHWQSDSALLAVFTIVATVELIWMYG
jgi:hypothetical protein